MDEVMSMLRKIQKELDEQKSTIVQSAEKVTEQVTQNIQCIFEEKFKILEEKYENLKEKIENQEKRLYFLEKQSRQRNVVFFGIEEKERSYADLEKNLLQFINDNFSLNINKIDIQEIKRIGKKDNKPRPVIATFTTLGTKIEIFKKSYTLKNTPYYIKEDLPKYVLEKRKELQEQLKLEKEKGNSGTIRYDKLIIFRKSSEETNTKKRTLTLSPDNNHNPSQAEPKTSVNKKNKTYVALRRTSSVSEGTSKPGILNYIYNKNCNSLPNDTLNSRNE
ncbi:protein unc-13 homolog C-like [Aricia agestis]|uniref:protein unc-13 homolog C-like n=1 Tax=Aricia agestis TaxID=91739 RepID=UPI001C20B4B9|nr:protein unc-13 homolog C-like [Aricia agestis]